MKGLSIIGGIVISVLSALLTAAALWAFGAFTTGVQRIPVPTGAVVAFNRKSCPGGWSAYEHAQGRYVVGVNANGTLDAMVGTKLSDQENRPAGNHTHTYDRAPLGGSANDGIGPGGYDRKLKPTPTGPVVVAGAVVPDGTNAPYVQLLYCEKGQ